ncbi:spore germination protein [Paenibacillus doosanensis]|uniref:Spore germination protein B1 n=1 Tax=Paenibacillus konkukensis TaxID=2020716 RepID=A0ABY4RVR1_9BACL|nr:MULTISPECIES: spore germination protein [Paenibacillus]MCS7464710.1 spore germination protein [Paenibacillus doosanensis]UQZ85850.1 Spore germination protein B1 [Paenibacillus konkukensis]
MNSTQRPATTADQAGLQPDLSASLTSILTALGHSEDLIVKEIAYGEGESCSRVALLYIDGLVDNMLLHTTVIEPLMALKRGGMPLPGVSGLLPFLRDDVLAAGHISVLDSMDSLFDAVLSGDAVVLIDRSPAGLRISVTGGEERSVSEPTQQTVVRGPMEAFTESIRTNTSLIRRKIKDPNLWLECKTIGTVTKTNVCVMFVHGVADERMIDEVRKRLDAIMIDGVLEGGYIEEFIQDKGYTPFPTVYNTERPDTVAAALLEGRAAILVDGTPFVMLVPALFVHFFQSAEDYYQRADISTLLRMIRYLSFFISMLAPSFYIAVTTFHQEMLPTSLLINLAAQREGVPFPAFIEALLMETTYEILREAGVRMPRTVGQAVSIVGTLVIGQAAVEAGVVSAAMVILVSITAISSYVIPAVNMSISVRMIRFLLMGLSATFGLYGILVGILGLVIHLSGLYSFGIPYMSPFGPFILKDQKDSLFRLRWPRLNLRPRLLNRNNPVRQKSNP